MISCSLKKVDGQRAFLLLGLLLQDENYLHVKTGVLEFLLGGHDVADWVLVVDATHFGCGVGVVVDGDEAVEVGHHQVPMH